MWWWIGGIAAYVVVVIVLCIVFGGGPALADRHARTAVNPPDSEETNRA